MDLLNNFLFIALPYVGIAVFLAGCIYRYKAKGFTYSALSSQFVDGGGSYLATVLFHWGILMVFIAHLAVFLFPKLSLAWHSDPVRLIADQVVALAFGLGALVGLVGLFVRRIVRPRLQAVTSRMDVIIELLLIAQIALGLWIALGYRWGYSWFASDMSPYLWSIVTLNPEIDAVSAMPLVIKLHVAGAFVILGLVPFSRLVHFLVAPFHYTWRNYQQVIWYWDRKRVRTTDTAWTTTPPSNN